MHILIVTQYFYPEVFRINDLALELKNKGYTVTVLTGIPNYPKGVFFAGYGIFKKRHENYHGVNIIRVPLVPRGDGTKLRLILNYFSYAFFAMLMAPFVCRKQYDAIFVFQLSPVTVGLPAMVLKKIKQVPILFWVQDLWPESLSAVGAIHSKRILAWIGALTKFIYKGCDRILVQSKAFTHPIEQMGVESTKISYFPNAAEDLYGKAPTGDELWEREALPVGFRIVYAGNIGVAQSFETILDAAVLLKKWGDIHWVIIGDGRKRAWLIEQILVRELSNTVHLIEQKPIEQMPYYFGLADALLVSLKQDPVFSLTIPSKLQSYLAYGKPILAAIDGEAARIVQESGAGLVGVAENAKSLSENVLTLYNTDSKAREVMGRKGRSYFELHFERNMLFEKLEGWMREVVEDKNL